jgi:phosphoribosylformylglycinamidine synthase PurS subunit
VKVTVLVRPKQGIRDPQGETIAGALSGLGYPVADVRAGKVFDLEVEASDRAEAERLAGEMAERVLSNDLIEGFEVVIGG